MSQVVNQRPFKDLIGDPKVTERFEKMLGDNSTAFLMSVLNCVQNNDKLQQADPQSVLMASAVAGTLNLPIDPNLGQAYIIPYNVKTKDENGKDVWVVKAQFQIGYKGLIQLGHRTRQFKAMNVVDVRKSELVEVNRLTGEYIFEWNQDQDARKELPVIGYVSYFGLTNGFSKMMYMTVKEINQHAKTYSKTYGNEFGRWTIDFDGMAKKTTLKLLLDKYAPKSVEMQKAISNDQGVFDADGSMKYLDNPKNQPIDLDELYERELKQINELLAIEGLVISEDERLNIDRIIEQKEVESYKKVIVLLTSRKPKTNNKKQK